MQEKLLQKNALFIIGAGDSRPGPEDLEDRLESGPASIQRILEEAGFLITLVEIGNTMAQEAAGKALVVISSSVLSVADTGLSEIAVPIIVLNKELFEEMGLVEPGGSGEISGQTAVKILQEEHPMAGDCAGVVKITSSADTLDWGSPVSTAIRVACINGEPDKVTIFGYEPGRDMARGTAPARRVGIFFSNNIARTASKEGEKLFKASALWAISYGELRDFDKAFREEWNEIYLRRAQFYVPNSGFDAKHGPKNLVGLSLAGGGIRSATFCLGILQGMRNLELLRLFDYVSTVSGGGYTGGWWSAWLSRAERSLEPPGSLFPAPEKMELDRSPKYIQESVVEGSMSAAVDPVHHIRLFANYITPRKGLLSVDTWRAVAVVTRNLMFTWLIFLPMLLVIILLGQLYFVAQLNSNNDFFHPIGSKQLEIINGPENLRRSILADIERKYEQNPSMGQAGLDDLKNTQIQDKTPEMKEALERKKQFYLDEADRFLYDEQSANLLKTGAALVGSEDPSIALMSSLPGSREMDRKIAALLTNEEHTRLLWERFMLTLKPLYPIAGWIVLMMILYMVTNMNAPTVFETTAHIAGAFVIMMLMLGALNFYLSQGEYDPWFLNVTAGLRVIENRLYTWKAGAWTAVALLLWLYATKVGVNAPANLDPNTRASWKRDVKRFRIVRVHATLLASLVVLGLALGISGFGYEIVTFVFNDPWPKTAAVSYVAKAGGWLAVIAAIGGSIFTAVKSAPAGGAEDSKKTKDNPMTHFILAITPTLVVVVVAVFAAWFLRLLLEVLRYQVKYIMNFTTGIFLSVLLCLLFALYESRRKRTTGSDERIDLLSGRSTFKLLGLSFLIVLVIGFGVYCLFTQPMLQAELKDRPGTWFITSLNRNGRIGPVRQTVMLAIAAIAGFFIILRLLIAIRASSPRDDSHAPPSIFSTFVKKYPVLRHTGSTFLALLVSVLVFILGLIFLAPVYPTRLPPFELKVGVPLLLSLALTCVLLCLVFVIYDWVFEKGGSERALWLTTIAYVTLILLLVTSFYTNYEEHTSIRLAHTVLAMMGIALAWVIALGWMANPNNLSMHAFYKERLTRAYLGASNGQRQLKQKEIRESVQGDDILLHDLRNCERGAPYHLVNTTLNLIAGKDLTTAQRSAATFIFSRLHCGSNRTGFRPTNQYMRGRLTLGTAVAISGAAFSPNMGSKTQSASLAILLTLLNARLGYWAPTPNKSEWQSPQARLWPYYLLRESLSQTNDLTTYCYLTDGGHFDNTGLYSLVERGCRYIVMTDNGADTEPCFSDLGEAIRRCRIDFGAEIDIDISPLETESKLASAHYVVGKIVYSADHVSRLGWKITGANDEELKEERTGIIILFKPTRVADETVDVRQYGIENSDFPQQTTLDQWFDESQFESYRRLGQFSVEQAFGRLASIIDTSSGMVSSIRFSRPLTPDDVKGIFQEMYEKAHSIQPSANPKGQDATWHLMLD